jgi:acyl dehydratase
VVRRTGDPVVEGTVLALGSYEDALEAVGARAAAVFADHDVSWALVKYFCAMVRDANASYWDDELARQVWGGIVAPPAMLMTWALAPEWAPWHGGPAPLLLADVPLPGTSAISTDCEAEFFRPVRVGDRLSMEETVVSVSPRKQTRLGPGHFVTTEATYRSQEGELVARYRHVLLRFTPEPAGAPDPPPTAGR